MFKNLSKLSEEFDSTTINFFKKKCKQSISEMSKSYFEDCSSVGKWSFCEAEWNPIEV